VWPKSGNFDFNIRVGPISEKSIPHLRCLENNYMALKYDHSKPEMASKRATKSANTDVEKLFLIQNSMKYIHSFRPKMVKIFTLFWSKTAQKPYTFHKPI